MKKTSENPAVIEGSTPADEFELILKRLEELEERCTQIESALKDMVTFDALTARLTGAEKKSKTRKRTRAKREWTQEEKTAFHERMVEARQAKEKARQKAAEAEAKKK